VRADGQTQLAQPQRLRAADVAQEKVALTALEDEVGVEALGGTDIHPRRQLQVALPAHGWLQPGQQRGQRERFDVGVQFDLRQVTAQVHAHLVPAQRHRVGQAQAARVDAQGDEVAGGAEIHFGAQVARIGPGRSRRGRGHAAVQDPTCSRSTRARQRPPPSGWASQAP